MNHLFVALGRKGLGEGALGVRLARSLKLAGDGVFFLSHDSNAGILKGWRHMCFGGHAAGFFPLYLADAFKKTGPKSIILADYFTATMFFKHTGLSESTLSNYNCPVFGIDTWGFSISKSEIDVFGCDHENVSITKWQGVTPITPVPFVCASDVSFPYSSLPLMPSLTSKVRRHIRHTLGVGEGEKAVLLCTAEWQHARFDSEDGRRLAQSVPLLIALILDSMPGVHLVHIGPQAYEFGNLLEDRYHWLPPSAPEQFDSIVASVDLHISANISATTIAKCMVAGVPVSVIENSHALNTVDQALGYVTTPFSSLMTKWLEQALPLFPFSLWPVGYYDFLKPVLHANPYYEALDVIEVLDESRLRCSWEDLLFDSSKRHNVKQKYDDYIANVLALPSGADTIHQLI